MRAAGVTLMSDMITLRLTCLPCGPSCYSQARRQLHDFEYMRAPLLLPGPHELRHIYIYIYVRVYTHTNIHSTNNANGACTKHTMLPGCHSQGWHAEFVRWFVA